MEGRRYMQVQLLAEEERDEAERTRAPVKVMRETAVTPPALRRS
jgi:hypothetical protein